MLKVYKKTVVLCIWVTVIAFLCSILLESLGKIQIDFTFLINYLTGIACSAFVVFLTTLLQFRIEQRRVKKEYSSALQRLFFNKFLSFHYDEERLNDRLSEHLYDEINQAFIDTNNYCSEFCCFGKKEQIKFDKVFQRVGQLYVTFMIEQIDSHKDAILSVVRHRYLIDAADATISFLEDGFDRRQIVTYRDEMKKERFAQEQSEVLTQNNECKEI